MAFNGSSLQHPQERLPLPAISVLDIKSEVNFQSGQYFNFSLLENSGILYICKK